MQKHCILLRAMLEDEEKAPREYQKLLSSFCHFNKPACKEMTKVVHEIVKDEQWHYKVIKQALDEYCVDQGD
jgi:rubrerythrin